MIKRLCFFIVILFFSVLTGVWHESISPKTVNAMNNNSTAVNAALGEATPEKIIPEKITPEKITPEEAAPGGITPGGITPGESDEGTAGEEPVSEEAMLEQLTSDLTSVNVPFVRMSSDLAGAGKDKKKLVMSSQGPVPYEIEMRKEGALSFSLQMVSPLKKGERITLKIYHDGDFSSPLLYKKIESSESKIEFISFFKEGTYDFIFTIEGMDKAYANMTFFAYNTSNFTAKKQNGNYIGYGNNKKVYIKVKAKKAGILSFTTAMQVMNMQSSGGFTGIRFELLDSGKNAIVRGKTEADKAYKLNYGVKKGTYYIVITPTAGLYKFSFSMDEYAGSKNTAKETAYKLKQGKTRYQVFAVGNEKNVQHWFKFTLKSPSDLTLKMEFSGYSGTAHASLYNGDEMIKLGESSLIEFPANKLQSVTWQDEDGGYGQWPAGTYYLRIGKDDDYTNGVVKIQIS